MRRPELEPLRMSLFFSSACRSVTPSSESSEKLLRFCPSSSCCESDETSDDGVGGTTSAFGLRSGKPSKMIAVMNVLQSEIKMYLSLNLTLEIKV